MKICEEDKCKTVFCTKYNHFEYLVIPFSLFNIPVNFQGYIIKVLAEKLEVFVIVFLDNILIYINKMNHVDAVYWVFDQLKKHSLYINLKKCRFHQDEVQFFDYVVFLQSIRIENKKIEVIYDWPEPQLVQNI